MKRLKILVALLGAVALGAVWSGAQEKKESAKPSATEGAKSEKKAAPADAEKKVEEEEEPVKAIVSGKVIFLADALKKRGVKNYAEDIKNQVVLLTNSGEIIPITPDWRGRAFYQDERLRDRNVDLVVNRREGVPWVQVLSIYVFDEKGARQIMDYWCDICAIPMYEIKECECCQGPIRLRLRPQELPKDLGKDVPAGKTAEKK